MGYLGCYPCEAGVTDLLWHLLSNDHGEASFLLSYWFEARASVSSALTFFLRR